MTPGDNYPLGWTYLMLQFLEWTAVETITWFPKYILPFAFCYTYLMEVIQASIQMNGWIYTRDKLSNAEFILGDDLAILDG